MSQPLHRLPLRQTAEGERIETRPACIEEWLDSLPYMDFDKTVRLLYRATEATNRQPLKPEERLELVELYSRPYQYYLDSRIRGSMQHTLTSVEALQSQIDVMKGIAINLAYGCRLGAEATLTKKTLWRKSRPPIQAMLLSMTYLSHALVFSYQEYAATPKNIWRELHFIYGFAEGLGQENATLTLPVGDAVHRRTSIASAYKRIVLTAMADPHQLPFGAVWEVYEQLHDWTDLATLSRYGDVPDPAGRFVINLDSDTPPLPCNKFRTSATSDRMRLLEATELNHHLETLMTAEERQRQEDLVLSPYYARLILEHVARAWNLPPQRQAQRETDSGHVQLACGFNATYFFNNNENEFRPPTVDQSGEIILGEGSLTAQIDVTPEANHHVDTWDILDRGPGGFALTTRDKPRASVRTGDLVVLRPESPEPGRQAVWSTGVIRWLMVRRNGIYRIGIEIIAGSATAAAVHALSGSVQDRQLRRALLISDEYGETAVLTGKGLHIADRELEIHTAAGRRSYRAGELRESTLSFEYFLLQPAE
jgi:hypothetical protein